MREAQSSVILVFNDKGQLALQLRSRTDNKYPLHWDFSAAGGIESGEKPLDAAIRELQEEIGITSNLEFLTELVFQDEKGRDRLYIYKIQHNGPFKPDKLEVERVEFFDFPQIEQMLKSGEKFHPEFPFVWNKKLILGNKDENK